ncbi:MAG: MFS transporter [Paludibacteraceae bacterium]|nr:MFS transporter [Bacteroidia bacterium]HRG02622.1 MFS transporter [Paludibacteraceae bacterium]
MNWTKKQTSTLAVVAITSFMGTFLISSINIALPSIEKTFGLNAIMLSWVVTSFLLATAMFLLPAGRWSDISGVVRLYKAGLIIFTLSSLLCGIAPSGGWLIAARYLQGIGAAFTNTTGQAILVGSFPPQNRGSVLGISVSSVYLGLSFGPFVGGLLTQQIGWRSIFMAAALIGLVSTVVSFLYLGKDEQTGQTKQKMGLKGVIFFMLGLVCMVYGSSLIPATSGWLIMAAGLAALILFWKIESKSKMPVFDTGLFTKNRMFAFSNLAALINYGSTSAIVFFLSLYLQKIQHLTPQQAGLILIAQPIMMTLFSPLVGRLSDRHQPRYFATSGMAMCSVGLASMSFLNEVTPHWVIISILIWIGIGFALFSSPNMNLIMSSVNRTQYGLASGTAASMRVIGQITSMTIVTLLFAGLFSGKSIEKVSDSLFLTAMKWGFITFSLTSLVGIYFSYVRGNVKRKTPLPADSQE